MAIELPQTNIRRWTGPYLGNYYGTLWRTYNIDLENSPGNISLSRSFDTQADTSDTNMLGLGVIDNFTRTDADGIDRWWALTRNGKLSRTDSDNPTLPSASWDEDTITNSPVDGKDMTVHENDSDSFAGNNRLLVTRDTDIASLNDTANSAWNRNWWVTTKGQTGLMSGVPHPIEYFPLRRISVIGDANFVHTVDKNLNASYKRLILPPYYQIESIFTTAYKVWILCSGKFGRNGAIVEWDGSAESYNRIYDAQSIYPLSGVNYHEVPIVANNRGLILEFDANGFSPMVRNGQQISFPFYEELGNAFIVPTSQLPIAPRGMTVTDDGLIYINAKHPGINSQRSLGGVWCLNPNTGNFYLKNGLGHNDGDNFGTQIVDAPGALKNVNIPSSATGEYLIAGGRIESSVGSSVNKIWTVSRTYNNVARKGFFITQYFLTANIKEMWESVWTKFSAFKSTSDKIIIKARGVNPMLDVNRQPIQKTITWTSGTTFTVTLNGSDDALVVGDEVEIVGGASAGMLAHITTISGSHAALQTITIDETNNAAATTSYARFDRWKKLGIIDSLTKYSVPLNVGITSSFVQFKIEVRGQANDFNIQSLILYLKTQVTTKK